MNLLVDIGNTLCKWAIYKGNKQIQKGIVVIFDKCFVESLIAKGNNIKTIILSSVRILPDNFLEYLEQNFHIIQFNHKAKLPIIIKYDTPETLGVDRLAAAVGAYSIYPNKYILIIDMGTAITIDMLNEKAEYIGGNISLGITMRFKALNTFTDKLPLIEKGEIDNSFGKNTEDAIRKGVQKGVMFELKKYAEEFKHIYANSKIIITGGDARNLYNQIDNNAEYIDDLVFIGLLQALK